MLDHEDIPGFMDAMRMDFPAGKSVAIENLRVGDAIAFELTMQPDESVAITKIEALPVGTRLRLAAGKQ